MLCHIVGTGVEGDIKLKDELSAGAWKLKVFSMRKNFKSILL